MIRNHTLNEWEASRDDKYAADISAYNKGGDIASLVLATPFGLMSSAVGGPILGLVAFGVMAAALEKSEPHHQTPSSRRSTKLTKDPSFDI